MTTSPCRISLLVLEQLALGEKRILSLVVAIRRVLARSEVFKGDLNAVVKVAVRKLVAAGAIFDMDGVYSLRRARK